MKRMIASLLVALFVAGAFAQTDGGPVVSEKKEIAIFALGYYGYSIPYEALGSIDISIQKVFVDIGRFKVIAMTQRFNATDVNAFIEIIRRNKTENFELPEKYRTYEAVFTEADFNKIVNAFIIAIPVVTSFDSQWNAARGYYETNIEAAVTFINPNDGSVYGIAQVSTSGTDKANQITSMQTAIEGIPGQLTYEIRKIPAFQISTRVLATTGSELKMQLGLNMGIMTGDEYALIIGGTVEGYSDTREAGLVTVKSVGAEVSTAYVVYSDIPVEKDMQLREIPRAGANSAFFCHYIMGESMTVPLAGEAANPDGGTFMIGMKVVGTRGFFDGRPYLTLQVPTNGIRMLGSILIIPIDMVIGWEQNLFLGRLTVTPYGGVGASYVYISELISGASATSEDKYIPHVGAQAYIAAKYLLNRDMYVYIEGGAEYWLSISPIFSNYGGLSVGAGVEMKF